MSNPSALDICRTDLFTKADELRQRFPPTVVEKVLRIREMYNWFISNPDASDREFAAEIMQRHGVAKSTAYADLAIVESLLPMLATASRDFHRWRFNEMIMRTYKKAAAKGDTKTMERAASSYAKYNRVDLEDEQAVPYDMIVVQPFTATDDPSVLGIKPIPNIQQRIAQLIDKYRAESIDIQDVEFEEADLEFDSLFPLTKNDSDNGEESLLQ